MMKNKSFLKRFSFALNGLWQTLNNESSFRTQVVISVLGFFSFLVIQPSVIWWALNIILAAAIFAAELFNTAIENLIDQLHPQPAPKLGLAKDAAAGAVLVLSAAAVLMFCLMIYEKYFSGH